LKWLPQSGSTLSAESSKGTGERNPNATEKREVVSDAILGTVPRHRIAGVVFDTWRICIQEPHSSSEPHRKSFGDEWPETPDAVSH